MKKVLVAGDSLDNSYAVVGYPASGGWTLRLRLIPQVAGSGTAFTLDAVAEGDDYRLQVGPETTVTWVPGDYTLERWVEKTGARWNAETDPALPPQVRILPDPATATSFDGRSEARKALERVEATLAGSSAYAEYEINNRRLVYYKPAELIVLVEHLRAQVAREDAAVAIASGMGNPRRVYVRFGRA